MAANRDYSLTGADGQQAVEAGLASAEWYASPIPRKRMKELMKRSDQPALRDTAVDHPRLGVRVRSLER